MSFSEIIEFIREEGAVNNPVTPFLSKVISNSPFEINNGVFSLYNDDVLIDSDLIVVPGDTVLLIPVGDKFIITNKVVKV